MGQKKICCTSICCGFCTCTFFSHIQLLGNTVTGSRRNLWIITSHISQNRGVCLIRTTELSTMFISGVCGSRIEPSACRARLRGSGFRGKAQGSLGPLVSIQDKQADRRSEELGTCTVTPGFYLSPFISHRTPLTESLHNMGESRGVGSEGYKIWQ